MSFNVQKQIYKIKHTVNFKVNGGDSISFTQKTYNLGDTYEEFPTVTKEGYIINGWYDDPIDENHKINSTDKVNLNIKKLYAHYIQMSNYTSFEITTTSSYKKFGIYSATLKSGSSSVIIDWGDGNVEEINGNISQKSHTYTEVGTFIVKISDNISSLQVSSSTTSWYNDNFRYVFKKILTYSTSITAIPSYCYYYCYYLTEVQADLSHISSMGTYAFYYCYNLTSISWLKNTSITRLPDYCFYYCYNLNSLDGCQNIISLGSYCFYYCYNLTSLNYCQKVTSLGSYCFYYAYKLTSFTGIGNITMIPNYCFQYAGRYYNTLTNLNTLPNTVTRYCPYCFGYSSITDFSKVRTTDTLDNYCFAYTRITNLNSFNQLKTKTYLPYACFYYCQQLTSIDLTQFTNLTSIPDDCFYYTNTLNGSNRIKLPTTLKNIGQYSFYQSGSSYSNMNLDFNNLTNLTSIGNYSFSNCTTLTAITLPNVIKSIGQYAFYQCYNLKNIYLKDTQLTSIGSYAFCYDYNLTAMSLPSTLTILNNYSLAGCRQLGSISCYNKTAPTVYNYTFGYQTYNSTYTYTGYTNHLAGTNTLYLMSPNSGYNSSYWQSTLLNSSYCGFHTDVLNESYELSDGTMTGLKDWYLYTGNEIVPEISVYNNKGTQLTENTQWRKVLTNNINVGTAQISAVGISPYKGFLSSTFQILAEAPKFTELEYIKNDGHTQYIKTGIIPTENAKFELKYKSDSVTQGSDCAVFFGYTYTDHCRNSMLLRYGSDTSLQPWFGQSDFTSPEFTVDHSNIHTTLLQKNKCTHDSTEYTIASNSITGQLEVYLFCGNYSGRFWRPQEFKCYYFKIYENNILVRDFAPAKDPNGIVCMYDKVSEKYFYNQGSGNFTAGPEKT